MTHVEMQRIVRQIDDLKSQMAQYVHALEPVATPLPESGPVPFTDVYKVELNHQRLICGNNDTLNDAERTALNAVKDLARWKICDIEKQIAALESSVQHVSVNIVEGRQAPTIWDALKRKNIPTLETWDPENTTELRIPVKLRFTGATSGHAEEMAMRYINRVFPTSPHRGILRRPTRQETDMAKKHPRYKPYPDAGEPVLAVKWACSFDSDTHKPQNTHYAVAWSNEDGWWVSHNIAVSDGLVSRDGTGYLQPCPNGCPATDRYNKYGVCESRHICMYDRIGPEQTTAPVSNHLPVQPPAPLARQIEELHESLSAELGQASNEQIINDAEADKLTPEEKDFLAGLMDEAEMPQSKIPIRENFVPFPQKCSTDSKPEVKS